MFKIVALALLAFSFNLVHCDTCGKRTVLRRALVNYGNSSYPGQWPWHAALFHRLNESDFQYACGGSIVSSSYVITAAHCMYPGLTMFEIQVQAGIINIRGVEKSLQQRSAIKIEQHKDYRPTTLENDIAILKLSEELEITDYVRPICLWEESDAEDLIVGKDGYVVGWGKDERKTYPDLLKHAVMPIVSREVCRDSDRNYYTGYLFDRKTFCAGYRDGTSASNGDSGGGLFIEVNGTWILRGIVSNGKLDDTGSLDTTSFIVFTDVAYYIKWIRKVMELLMLVAACGNKPRPLYVRYKKIEYREQPWFGVVRSVDTPSVNLCEVAIISAFYVLAPADRIDDQYFDNPSLIEVVFHRDDREILSTHQIRKIHMHENLIAIALLELTEKLAFDFFLQPICIGFFSKDSLELNTGECESSIRAVNPHAYCHHESRESLVDLFELGGIDLIKFRDFDLTEYNGKTFLRGVVIDKFFSNEKSTEVIANISYYASWIEETSKMP